MLTQAKRRPNDWIEYVETLQTQYGEEIQQYCFVYLADADLALDATQEIFYKLLLQEHGTLTAERAWLYRCARNHCLNTIRQRSRQSKALTRFAQTRTMESPQASVLSRLVHNEIHERLNDLVFNLPLDRRVPLFLRYFAGFTRSEIMRNLDMSEHLVKARLHRALKDLRKHSSLRMT